MSIDFTAWLGQTNDLIGTPTDHESERAASKWRIIQDRPESIVLWKPDGTELAAQTLRVEVDNTATEQESAAGLGAERKLIIFGVRNHATVADSDIARGYRFIRESREYRVIELIRTIGGLQAVAESVG